MTCLLLANGGADVFPTFLLAIIIAVGIINLVLMITLPVLIFRTNDVVERIEKTQKQLVEQQKEILKRIELIEVKEKENR